MLRIRDFGGLELSGLREFLGGLGGVSGTRIQTPGEDRPREPVPLTKEYLPEIIIYV